MIFARPVARTALILGLAALAACGTSLNPLNWFRGSTDERVVLYPEGGFTERVDFRDLIQEVTELTVEPVAGGAVIRATGLPPRQGFWDAELTSETDLEPVDGVLELAFRIRPPAEPTDVNVPRSREVVVGVFVSRQKLEAVREIRVLGQINSRVARR